MTVAISDGAIVTELMVERHFECAQAAGKYTAATAFYQSVQTGGQI